jgi:hypothetical protein
MPRVENFDHYKNCCIWQHVTSVGILSVLNGEKYFAYISIPLGVLHVLFNASWYSSLTWNYRNYSWHLRRHLTLWSIIHFQNLIAPNSSRYYPHFVEPSVFINNLKFYSISEVPRKVWSFRYSFHLSVSHHKPNRISRIQIRSVYSSLYLCFLCHTCEIFTQHLYTLSI